MLIGIGISAQSLSVAGQSLDFSSPLTANPTLTAGGTCVYDNVVDINGADYDAIVTIDSISNALITNFDNSTATNGNDASYFSPQVIWTGAGSIAYSIDRAERHGGGRTSAATEAGDRGRDERHRDRRCRDRRRDRRLR